MEIDVHGLYLEEAIEEIIYRLDECRIQGITQISIIHRYKRGNTLRNYINSKGFVMEMKREGFLLKQIDSSNPGITKFQVHFLTKKKKKE